MPDDKMNVGLIAIFFIAAVMGEIYNLPYCFFVSGFLCLLFGTALQRSFIWKKQKKLGIIKNVKDGMDISRKQYYSLYITSAIIGSILNVAGVFFSMPSYIMFGIDVIIIAVCIAIHHKMQVFYI